MAVFRRKGVSSEVSDYLCESDISESSSGSEIDEDEFQETESNEISSESGSYSGKNVLLCSLPHLKVKMLYKTK
jgi:hypothetical protein